MSEDNKIITNITKSHILQIQKAMRQNKLVIFAGAGVSKCSGVPLWGELINELKKELDLDPNESDYLKIPQLYRNLRKDKEYFEKIKEILKDGKVQFNDVHRAILDLNPCHIVTTNYDDLFEQAIKSRNENFYTISQDKDLPYNGGEKFLIKMHGDFKSGDIVLTENDYLDYSKNYPLIRAYVMSLFASKLVLFIGFSFSDINLKYILRDVRSCLGDDMQPVYMLAPNNSNNQQLSYLDFNYIHVVQLSKEQVKKTLEYQYTKLPNEPFSDERSNTLLSQLYLLNHYSENNNDAISVVYSFLTQDGEQLTYLGHYIKYIFPRKYWRNVRLQYGSLIMPQFYNESIKSIMSDSEESKKYRYDNRNNIICILLWLNQNGVESIGDFNVRVALDNILTEEDRSKLKENALVPFYQLNINALSKSLKDLRDAPLSFGKQDMLYPFMLCKIGRYKQAYDIYKKLSNIMMENRKYVLYFICLYNMQSLYGPVYNEIANDDLDSSESFMEEIKKIDLNEIVKSLPLSEIMQKVLSDLANDRYLLSHLLDAEQFCDKVREQREASERGGASINDNINHVLLHYDDLIDFCNNNYIFIDTLGRSRETYLKIAEAILQSILTKKHPFGTTKLPSLYGHLAHLFIFHLKSNDLKKLLSKVVSNRKLPIADSFKNEIQNILNNLYDSNDERRHPKNVIKGNIIGECLKNIMLLSIYTEDNLDLPHIHSLISNYWYEGGMSSENSLFADFFCRYKVPGDEAVDILEKIIHSINDSDDFAYALGYLCDYAKNENKVLDELISAKQLQNANNIHFIASLCKVATEDVRHEIVDMLRTRVKSLCQLVEAECYSEEKIITEELLLKFKDIFKVSSDNNLYPEEWVLTNLLRYSIDKRPELKNAIDSIFSSNSCYQFFKDPLNYSGSVSDIKGSWLLYLDDQSLTNLIANSQIRRTLKQFCDEDENAWNINFKKKIWNML